MYRKFAALTILALFAGSTYAQTLDCAALANSTEAEPAGYAAQCGPFVFDTSPSGDAPAAPTDLGSVLDLRGDAGPPNTLYSYTLNNFPARTALGVTNPSVFALDYDPTATTLYGIAGSAAVTNPNGFGTINTTTGAFTLIATLSGAAGANGMTIDPVTGDAYINDATNLYSFDLTTGVATLIGTFGGGVTTMVDISMNCDGEIYGHDIGTDGLYSVNPATGAATLIGLHGLAANFAQGMDFDNDDGTLYAFVYTGGGTNTYGTFNLTTGAITPLFTNNPMGEYEGATPSVCAAVSADLSVTKTAAAPTPLLIGSTLTYTLTASNAGPSGATGVAVSDTLPANLNYVSNTCGATVAGQVVTWSIGAIASGGSSTCDIVTTVSTFGPIDNTAVITGADMDPNSANNSGTSSLAGAAAPLGVATAVPTLGQLGLLLLGMLVLGSSVLATRR